MEEDYHRTIAADRPSQPGAAASAAGPDNDNDDSDVDDKDTLPHGEGYAAMDSDSGNSGDEEDVPGVGLDEEDFGPMQAAVAPLEAESAPQAIGGGISAAGGSAASRCKIPSEPRCSGGYVSSGAAAAVAAAGPPVLDSGNTTHSWGVPMHILDPSAKAAAGLETFADFGSSNPALPAALPGVSHLQATMLTDDEIKIIKDAMREVCLSPPPWAQKLSDQDLQRMVKDMLKS